MGQRATAIMIFAGYFIRHLLHIREVIVGLVTLVVLGGVMISVAERIAVGKAIYFAFITGLTIGYGDIAPKTVSGQAISVAIGMIGIIFTGMIVAISTRSLADFSRYRHEQQQ